MPKTLSSYDEEDINAQLNRFEKLAPNKKFELEPKDNGRYIHIKRDGKIIGCFTLDVVFEFHSSHPWGKAHSLNGKSKRILLDDFTDSNIESAIEYSANT